MISINVTVMIVLELRAPGKILILFKACVCYFLSVFFIFSPNDSSSDTIK